MGFTIDGLREIRELRLPGRLPRRLTRNPVRMAVAEYTGLWGWDVTPGARALRRGPGPGRPECSCGRAECASPGAHPLDPALTITAGIPLRQALADWDRAPGATVLLPTGRGFDVIEVPCGPGRRALLRLERIGLPLGPVAEAPHGRVWFFVAPGAAAQLPQLLYRMGWDDALPQLRCLGPGGHITAPPCEYGGYGPVRWLRAPDLECAEPPPARLLVGALAYVCHRAAG
ncbi:bifunctional DNA primase/polymerase [Streptomyces sp. XM4011]|uniref:bifunctional DNA primase/polymerase n=1 Tax=Streptomyces sp. XM4011 TaxID=2929780 RepID=UPI001FFA7F94|nr:bifunctional DNA primase/polymerase [Streptomyces sp. XM4011]MCK1813526.1 bifunctional DNA primase/polymerase [Streptomyces sp. XM4011]